MKPGDMGIYDVPHERVETSDGLGTLVHYEVAYRHLPVRRLDTAIEGVYKTEYATDRIVWRLGVILDKNPYNYSPAYYPERHILRRNIQ